LGTTLQDLHTRFQQFLFFLIFNIYLVEGSGITNELIDAKVPVDISFMIADFKYNRKDGVKICEVQHGTDSTFYGDRFSHGEPGIIAGNFYRVLLRYHTQFWTTRVEITEKQIVNTLSSAPEWRMYKKIPFLEKDPDFQKLSNFIVEDPDDIQSYGGIVCLKIPHMHFCPYLLMQYPGILFLDAGTADYWNDKYKMSQLFSRSPNLAQFKPRWNLYPKQYTPDLADKIIQDIPSEKFVIKPRSAYLGNGVIIVSRENLDETLNYILHKKPSLNENPDKSYHYWYSDKHESFLVEEFIASDPIAVSHFDNQIFQPTMRAAFLLIYNQGQITIEFLGFYWLLPLLPLHSDASLIEKHKAHVIAPYFCPVDPETISEVKKQLNVALTLLYREMIRGQNERD